MKRHYVLFALILVGAAFLLSLTVYSRLPQQVPTHWNIHGKVDDTSARFWGAFLMPLIMVAFLGFFSLLNWLSPRQFKLETFRDTWEFVILLVIALLLYDHALMIGIGLGWAIDMSRAALGGLFLFLAFLGNVLGKVRRNFWIGVRTPWTLASERVWNDTHRFAARVFVVAGILGFVAVMADLHPSMAIGILVAAALTTVVYSLVDYKRLENRGEV